MKLLTIKEAAALLKLPEKTAKRLLETLPCIDYGKGRGRGLRYLESDVEQFVMSMRKKKQETPNHTNTTRLYTLSPNDLFALTQRGIVQ